MPARSPTISPRAVEGNGEEADASCGPPPSTATIEQRIHEHVASLVEFATRGSSGLVFHQFETRLIPMLFALGRLLVALFLARRHEELAVPRSESINDERYERRDARSRELGTFFGRVRYWRTYMYGQGGGYYPLDRALCLPPDGFSLHLVGLITLLATKMSYAQVTLVVHSFLGWSPSQTTVERSVLGLGQQTAAWFENAPVPENDGEVLIIQVDSKATPTATESELEKRRGKRRPNPAADSPRHRARQRRFENASEERRTKGDKSKNGRAATLLVMYTLKRGHDRAGNPILKGPINRRVYASYAPKRHAFAIARREADRRGFPKGSGKLVQIVTDGDRDFARYVRKFFPEARHTLDVMHALEYVWTAGECLFREGSEELIAWIEDQKRHIYAGRPRAVLRELNERLAAIPKRGPGNKGKRTRLSKVIRYLDKRVRMMNYRELSEQDLELSSGAVEGAVRYVIGQRFDCGGMRWIKERSEPLLQLRCIDVNGHWGDFIEFVLAKSACAPRRGMALQAATPRALPSLGVAA